MSIVYIFTNEAMPGLVKIGRTKNLKQRLQQQDTTSIPLPFRCEFAARVTDADATEKLLHHAFGDRRVRDNREFFEIEPSRVIAAVKLTGGEEVTPSDDIAADEEGIIALEKPARRKASVNFEMIGLSSGTEIYFADDESITATVSSKWTIFFEGQEMSMSASALAVHHRRGRTWKAVNGANYWAYDGETVNERRNRLDLEAAEVETGDV
jgi:hypothetical protein